MSTEGETESQSKVIQRGLQFPAISLRDAVGRARTMWEEDKRNSVPFSVLAAHWKYSPKSSNARGVVAALSKFGLLEIVGGDYKLTNRALSILLAEGAESEAALKEAALAPKSYRDLWERYGVELPSDQSLMHKLIVEGYNPTSVGSLIKDWKDTIEFARLKKGDTLDALPPASDSSAALPTRDVVRAVGQTHVAATHQPPPMNPSIRYLPVPLMIGDAHIPIGMTNIDFDLLLKSLDLWKQRLVVEPEQPAPKGATPDDDGE